MKSILLFLLLGFSFSCTAQSGDAALLDSLVQELPQHREVNGAFKSSRVINGHSIEMIAAGALDFRILHRFGPVNTGIRNLFGLDEASMRIGFDYGLSNRVTLGIGRSTLRKELDGFIKWRIVKQGRPAMSLVWITGLTMEGTAWTHPDRKNRFAAKLAYYHQLLVGRKFSNSFSMQLAPTLVHRNLVDSVNTENDSWALGIGARLKLSKRVALVVDFHPVLAGRQPQTYDPLSVGIDIETGGHVFQLHFSNAVGMNEKEFITGTRSRFGGGDLRFGFNLSRIFQLRRN